MYEYHFTRIIHGRAWTCIVTPREIRFETGIYPHWHIFSDGTAFWDRFASSLSRGRCGVFPRVAALRIAAAGFRNLRRVTGGLFSDAGRYLHAA